MYQEEGDASDLESDTSQELMALLNIKARKAKEIST